MKNITEATQLVEAIVRFISSVHLRGALGEVVVEHQTKDSKLPLKYRIRAEMLQNHHLMLYFYFFFDYQRFSNKDDFSYLQHIQMTQKPLSSLPFSRVIQSRDCALTTITAATNTNSQNDDVIAVTVPTKSNIANTNTENTKSLQ